MKSAVTGEPIPVTRLAGEAARSGAINAGETFEMHATATAGESTYAGIVRWSRRRKPPSPPSFAWPIAIAFFFCRSRLLSPELAWALSGDPIRGLAVLVASTPCPLILAAPVAFIAGVAGPPAAAS